MKKILILLLLFGIPFGVVDGRANETGEEPPVEQPGKWEKATKEIGEAGHAVGDATTDSSKKVWESTKEGSVKAWGITKEKSKELWEKGKAKVHEATTPAAEGEPSAAEIKPEAAADSAAEVEVNPGTEAKEQ